jgi:hypothetical protein
MRILGILIGLLISLRGLCLPGGNFVFLLDSVAGNTQTQVSIPVRALNFDSVISIQGTIGFDTAELGFVGFQAFGLPSMSNANFGFSNVANGFVTFSWNEASLLPISVADSSVLFELVFQILAAPGTQSSVEFLPGPTILEVVNHAYVVIPYSYLNGVVAVKVPPTCPAPDSLAVSGIGQTQALLQWQSNNPGATYTVEWGPIGFSPGGGIGQVTGISIQGINTLPLTNLVADSSYAFYVQEQCTGLASLVVGPVEFVTAPLPALVPVVLFGDSVQLFPGDSALVGFRVRDFANIISMQFSLAWDTSVATYLRTTNYGLPNMNPANFNISQVQGGAFAVSWNDPSLLGVSVADSSAVFGIWFLATGAGSGMTPVSYTNTPLPLEVVDLGFVPLPTTTLSGSIERLDTSVSVDVLSGMNVMEKMLVYPNPVDVGLQDIRLKTDMDVSTIETLALIDLQGRQLSPALFAWTAEDDEIVIRFREALPAGQWLLRIQSATDMAQYRIMNLGK